MSSSSHSSWIFAGSTEMVVRSRSPPPLPSPSPPFSPPSSSPVDGLSRRNHPPRSPRRLLLLLYHRATKAVPRYPRASRRAPSCTPSPPPISDCTMPPGRRTASWRAASPPSPSFLRILRIRRRHLRWRGGRRRRPRTTIPPRIGRRRRAWHARPDRTSTGDDYLPPPLPTLLRVEGVQAKPDRVGDGGGAAGGGADDHRRRLEESPLYYFLHRRDGGGGGGDGGGGGGGRLLGGGGTMHSTSVAVVVLGPGGGGRRGRARHFFVSIIISLGKGMVDSRRMFAG